MKKKISLSQIALISVMSAAVYVTSAFLQISIPTPITATRLHMGNVMCLLSGMLLGSWQGGLAASIGSVFFDLTNPAYISSAPFTFLFKFLMAWLCGKITAKNGTKQKRFLLGAVSGSALYVVLYLSKNFITHRFILHLPLAAVWMTISQKAIVSGMNAVIAVCVAVPLGFALQPIVRKLYLNSGRQQVSLDNEHPLQ